MRLLTTYIVITLKAYKYQLNFNKTQKTFFNRSFGSYRFIYNWALERRKKAYEKYNIHLSYFVLANMLTVLKKQPGYISWLGEVSNECLQQALRNTDTAFKNFFKYKTGALEFKSRHKRQSIKNINGIKVNLNNGFGRSVAQTMTGIIIQPSTSGILD